MTAPISSLQAILTPERSGGDAFVARSLPSDEPRVFGGQMLGQAIAAAAATVDQENASSLHAMFIAPGDAGQPFEVAVRRIRDGRSFATRQIEIRQREALTLLAWVSFHDGDPGAEHQIAMPDVQPPEELEDQRETRRNNAAARGKPAKVYASEEVLDARPIVMPTDTGNGVEGRRCLWFRARAPLGEAPALHQAAIAFASDMGLVNVGIRPHNDVGPGTPLNTASLDHSIWFHRPARADEWLLHVQRSPTASRGRGLSLGSIYNRSGELVASTAQEILARLAR